MKPFLQRLAEEIAEHYGEDPGQLCVVLPNRRAGLYLKRYLSAELKKTAWSPQTFSVEDFITKISGLKIIDQAGLLFEFYHVHKEIHGDTAQDFDIFADWAQVLLKDFDEVDQYLVDPVKIFTFLNSARALSVWNLDGKPLTEHEKNYISFYNSFLDYYKRLSTRLTAKKIVYQGLAYRLAAENIASLTQAFPWKRIYFAGLNALSVAEETIIDHLLRQDLAEVFWDADAYYVKDEKQEAGEFIRKYLAKWHPDPVKWLENDYRLIDKKIKILGIPRSMGQAIKAGQIINQINFDAKAPDNTALVLPDEKLLLPVLYSLPGSIGPVNVTMGYPFKYTHLYHLVSLLFQMQENAEMFAQKRQNSTKSFYAKDILKILAHPYLLLFDKIVASGQVTFDRITESIRKKNRVFIGPGEIKQHAAGAENEYKNLVDNLFTPWTSAGEALDSILRTLEFIRDRLIAAKVTQTAAGQIDLEYVYFLSKVVKRCRTMMETYPFIRDLKTLRKILFQVLDTSRMPFTGEPLQGLQVMGVLETRAIDFENLVVLSVNDGILPSGRLPNSFIPFDIKYEFGLPTYRQKDAVFAYHFYRMLQRARNIFLIYDTEGDQMKGGEKSRFLMQLGYELPRYNSNSLISEELLGPDPPGNNLTNIIIREKTPAVMARLNEKAARGFSPTALNLYIRCPLQFYFQEVLGLSEAESIEETIEQKTMGTAIHKVFQRIYEPFTGKFLDPDTLYSRLSVTESVLSEAFGEFYKEGDLEYGKNHLIFKASQFLINEFIRHEIEELRNCDNPAKALKIISLETLLEVSLTIHISGAPYEIKLKGKTDRIDRFGDAVRIIDYKTGSVQASELKVRSWDTLLDDPKMSKAFQLLMYAWLYVINSKASGHEVQTGNITLRKISAGFMKVSLPGDQEIGNESMKAFEELLKELLARIFDQGILFTQTEDIENCTYCPFKSICSR